MLESLGLTLQQAAILGSLVIVYVVLSLFPFLWPLFIAFRSATAMPHRWKFCVLVGLLVYGMFSAITFCSGIPIEAFLVHIVPQLEYTGYFNDSWIIEAARLLSNYGWLFVPLLLVVLTVIVTRSISLRWPRLVVAWNG